MLIPLFNAWSVLGGSILLLLAIRSLDHWTTQRLQRVLSVWARQNSLRYSPVDRFQLAPRIREHLPHPGAADVVVRDVMYRTDQQNHIYLFTVRYRIGTIGPQRWLQMVASVTEIRGRSCYQFDHLKIADVGSLLSRYESLIQAHRINDPVPLAPIGSNPNPESLKRHTTI